MMNCFFVDCETDGLYGPFLSVAGLVTDGEGQELDCFYGAIEPVSLVVRDPWVRENVEPYLAQAKTFFGDEESLLSAFWTFWMRWHERVICIADVAYPVEARLFSRCVEQDVQQRLFLAPYPLYDLSTLLLARGIDPLSDRRSLVSRQLVRHDAMNDVRMTAELWARLMRDSVHGAAHESEESKA